MSRPASLLRSLGLAVMAVALPVGIAAQAADGLTVTTPYPAVVADPGGTVRLPLTIDGTTTGTIALEATGAPSGWTTSFRGGGSLVTAAYVNGSKPATVDLEVKVPSDAAPGTYRLGVRATERGVSATCRSRSASRMRRRVGSAWPPPIRRSRDRPVRAIAST